MIIFTKADGPNIQSIGKRMLKRPNPVFMVLEKNEFVVETNEGILKGKAGDYVAHDPISGHVWPVSAEYVKQHYDEVKDDI